MLYFKGKQKGLILTSTNQDYLSKTYGEEIAASTGQTVTLYPITKKITGRDIETILSVPVPATK